MLGRVRREGERNFTVPQRSISWHMQPTVIYVDSSSFFKDGRKIRIGDCALFKPPQDSPPFIGLIRCLTLDKENNLLLGVNWLYRPSELKLAKGAPLDCAPNEVFYSFHKDERIPAASLLHPCKVAFLPRGAELPKGASSFVCRRVYDIANKCLWWLTDQDYVNERQEELDKLLHKTRTEMHATLQSGGRSPKQGNGPTSTSQVKPGPDNAQNSPTSFSSQVKGKKRERGDHAVEPLKRERLSKTDDCDSAQYRPESHLKTDIARITEKGGVVDVEGVEKLVQLMQPDRMEKKMDLASRSMLAAVLASTDKVDCLTRFVQLRGLPVLDEWLQDIHKTKVGDNNSSKDADKSVEEFLLVLLRALDKIPVNLHALQMCNIGRSVNHLRSHKNLEIQRKARGLVDTWKKRVEAEMNNIDAKSGSAQSGWPSKSRLPEASHGVCRTPGGSEVAMKSSITQHSASKTTIKSLHGESNTKPSSSSPGQMKPALSSASCKESHPKTFVGGVADLPLIREDKSSSSNHSHDNSQSITGKEDGKGSTAVSASASKISSSSSRNRKNSGGSPGVTGGQKENSSSRSSSSHRSNAVEKLQSALTGERVSEAGSVQASNHKLIVKIPNRVPSPAQGVSVGSLEDPTVINSQTSSPLFSDKQEVFDRNFKEKSDAYRFDVSSSMKVDSFRNDTKDVLNGSGDGHGPPAVLPGEEQSMTTEDSRSLIEGPHTDRLKSRKLHETSFSPMNALIESCVKYSEAHSSLLLDDDVGMNLLASVATGEMSRSDMVSPADSADRSSPVVEEVGNVDEVKSKSSPESPVRGGPSTVCNDGENGDKKKCLEGSSLPGDGLHTAERNFAPSHASADIPAGEGNIQFESVSTDFRSNADHVLDISDKSYEKADTNKKIIGGEVSKDILEEKVPSSNVSPVHGNKVHEDALNADGRKFGVEVASSDKLCHGDCKGDVNDGDHIGTNQKLKSNTGVVKSEDVAKADDEKLVQTSPGWKLKSEIGNEVKVEGIHAKDKNCNSNFEVRVDKTPGSETAFVGQSVAGSASTAIGLMSHLIDGNVEQKKNSEKITSPGRGQSTSVGHEAHINNDFVGSTSAGNESDEADCASAVVESSSSSVAAASDPNGKIKFDLNEGFDGDDGKYGEQVDVTASVSTSVQMANSLPFVVNSIRSGQPASVTVAAAAKGPFVPPDDLLRSKGELGWKGSAATSAFRPAEPRKAAEIPLTSRNSPSDASTSKHGRVPLDFDLNVPDERVLEELSSRDSALSADPSAAFVSNRSMLLNENSVSLPVLGSGGLDLDLNRADEVNEKDMCSTSSDHKREGPFVHMKPIGVLPAADVRRDFDLNDGPGVDDSNSEHVAINQLVRAGTPSQLLPRMNYAGLGGLSSWFPAKNTFSTVTIPSMIPDRGDQIYPVIPSGAPHRTFGPAGVTPFTPDIYRGSVLSSSPAMSFPSSPFQYSVFPFGATFPLPSATFPVGATSYADSSTGPRLFAPPVNSHLLGPVGAVSSQFQRPYMVSLPDSSSNGGSESSRKWVRQGLDLNAGPGATESEARDDLLPLSSNQHSVAGSQAQAEEHARMYSVSGGIMKRKEPEGGWDSESFRYKQPSWQ